MTTETHIDIHAELAQYRQIAIVWSLDDVRDVRPDLTDDQCWEVLQEAERQHDATIGLSWDTLECIADDLFGLKPLTEGSDDEESSLSRPSIPSTMSSRHDEDASRPGKVAHRAAESRVGVVPINFSSASTSSRP